MMKGTDRTAAPLVVARSDTKHNCKRSADSKRHAVRQQRAKRRECASERAMSFVKRANRRSCLNLGGHDLRVEEEQRGAVRGACSGELGPRAGEVVAARFNRCGGLLRGGGVEAAHAE